MIINNYCANSSPSRSHHHAHNNYNNHKITIHSVYRNNNVKLITIIMLILMSTNNNNIVHGESEEVSAGGGGGGGEGGNASAHSFDIREHSLSLGVCAAIVFSFGIIFEFLQEKLFEYVEDKKHFQELANIIFREFSIVGIISFGIFLFTEAGLTDSISDKMAKGLGEDDPHDVFLTFEYIHIGIVLFLCLYVITGFYLLMVQIWISHVWEEYDAIDIKQMRRTVHGLSTSVKASPWDLVLRYQKWRAHKALNYLVLRQSVIAMSDAPRGFIFAVYLKYAMHIVTTQLLHLPPMLFFAITIIMWLPYIIEAISKIDYHSDYENMVHVGLGFILMFISSVLLAKCRLIVKEIANKYAVFKENVRRHRFESAKRPLSGIVSKSQVHDAQHHGDAEAGHGGGHHKVSIRQQFKEFRTETGSLFWFRRPGIIQGAIQLVLYLECIYFTWVMYSCYTSRKAWYWFLIYILLTLVNVLLIVPDLVGKYVQALYSSDLLDKRLVTKTIIKQIKTRGFEFDSDESNLKQKFEKYLNKTKKPTYSVSIKTHLQASSKNNNITKSSNNNNIDGGEAPLSPRSQQQKQDSFRKKMFASSRNLVMADRMTRDSVNDDDQLQHPGTGTLGTGQDNNNNNNNNQKGNERDLFDDDPEDFDNENSKEETITDRIIEDYIEMDDDEGGDGDGGDEKGSSSLGKTFAMKTLQQPLIDS